MSFSIEKGQLLELARKAKAAGQGTNKENAEMAVFAAQLGERDLKTIAFNAGGVERRGMFMIAPPRFGLGVRSGHLAASVVSDVSRFDDVWVATAGTPLRYALTNEIGATIRPKHGRFLALPTVNALTPTGDLKNRFAGLTSLRQARDPGGKPLFFKRAKRRGTAGGWLAGTQGKGAGTVVRDKKTGRFARGGALVLYFYLVTQVNVPARYAVRAARRRIDPQLVDAHGRRFKVEVFERFVA